MSENTIATAVKKKSPGSGRTKGSFSFIKVPLSALCGKFADTEQPVVISRKWAEAVGLTGFTSAPATTTLGSIEGQTPATRVTATVTDLDAD